MINLKALRSAKSTKIAFVDVNRIVNKEMVKNLRSRLNVSQAVFATIMNVSKKTIEAWEEGLNPIKGGAAVAIYLLDKHIGLSRDLIEMEVSEHETASLFPFTTSKKYFYLSLSGESNNYDDMTSQVKYVIKQKEQTDSCDFKTSKGAII